MSYVGHLRELGSGIAGIAVTDTLYVSPNGAGTNGKTWAGAFTTIQAALAAASTDAEECTQILIGPGSYNINTTADPTYTGNYHITGTHRLWAVVQNLHADATSVFKFTGKVSISDLAIFTTGTRNGVIFTGDGWRVRRCGFNSSGTSGATTSVYIDGSGGATKGGIMEDVQFIGHVSNTKAIYINTSSVNEFHNIQIHTCLTGIHIINAASDYNLFENCDIGDSALAIDIDAGNEQHFENIDLHHNTDNVDDEVGDSVWSEIHGQFDIAIIPADLAGTTHTAGSGAAWGGAVTWVASGVEAGPFRIVGVHTEPTDVEWHELRFSADAGGSYYDRVLFKAAKRESMAAPSGTEHIFNAKTELYSEMRSESGSNDCQVWIEIQRI